MYHIGQQWNYHWQSLKMRIVVSRWKFGGCYSVVAVVVVVVVFLDDLVCVLLPPSSLTLVLGRLWIQQSVTTTWCSWRKFSTMNLNVISAHTLRLIFCGGEGAAKHHRQSSIKFQAAPLRAFFEVRNGSYQTESFSVLNLRRTSTNSLMTLRYNN